MQMQRAGLVATATALLLIAGLTIWLWFQLPASVPIPVHYNLRGEPDGWADRLGAISGFVVLLGITAGVSATFFLAPRFDPRGNDLSESAGFIVTWIGFLVLMVVVATVIALKMATATAGAAGNAVVVEPGGNPIRLPVAALSALLVCVGIGLPYTRANFMLGIRTPWTLSSRLAWERTHKLGRWLFILAGACGILSATSLEGVWIVAGALAPAGLAVVTVFIYSYFVWKGDGARDSKSSDAT